MLKAPTHLSLMASPCLAQPFLLLASHNRSSLQDERVCAVGPSTDSLW
jgi:hypothetical protein